MKQSGGIAALIGVLAIICAIVAWEWYSHVSGNRAAPKPLRQVAASAAPSIAPSPAPVPSPSAGPVTYVLESPSAAPTATPAAAQTAAPYEPGAEPTVTVGPVIQATLAPHVVRVKPIMQPPDAPPRILAMSLSTPIAHGGQVVSGTVETSSNVASVEARIAGYSTSMRKVGVGKFQLSYRVPHLPFFLHRTYMIEVIARSAAGVAVRTAVPITIR